LDCGLRFGEVAKLTWADVDLARETLLLRDTKSSRNRVVYMTSRIKKILRAMTKGRPDELVFPGPENKPLREVSRVFERVVKELDFNRDIDDDRLKVVFHSLRHTHASRLLESGADVYYVKTLLGHRNIQTTERYLHVRSENLREAVKRMEQKSNVISLEETHHGTKAR
jgi:integrase